MNTFSIDGIDWLQQYVDPEDEVLDLGCGTMETTGKLKCKVISGVDAYQPYIDELKEKGHIYVYCGRIEKYMPDFKKKSFDVVMAIDAIEHLIKPAALRVIGHMERIARKRVVIFTTIGFIPQEREENPELQRHRCGFTPIEFEDLGYEVYHRIGGDKPSFLAVKEI